MLARFFGATAFAAIVGCRAPSSASPPSTPPPSAPCSSTPHADALHFPALRIDSNQRPFARDIFFAPGSSEPLAPSLAALDQIAETMKAIPSVSLLAVMGHTGTAESAEIADQRAARVIDLLIARGVERTRLEVRPFTPPPAVEVGRCGMTTPDEREIERKRALAAERAVHFAIVRVDEN
ncbi:MAG: hypothetical protein ABI183_17735 [Polyangiaceae bacterium]